MFIFDDRTFGVCAYLVWERVDCSSANLAAAWCVTSATNRNHRKDTL